VQRTARFVISPVVAEFSGMLFTARRRAILFTKLRFPVGASISVGPGTPAQIRQLDTVEITAAAGSSDILPNAMEADSDIEGGQWTANPMPGGAFNRHMTLSEVDGDDLREWPEGGLLLPPGHQLVCSAGGTNLGVYCDYWLVEIGS